MRGVSGLVPPAACADALAACRLRVPDLTPPTRREAEVRNTEAARSERPAAGSRGDLAGNAVWLLCGFRPGNMPTHTVGGTSLITVPVRGNPNFASEGGPDVVSGAWPRLGHGRGVTGRANPRSLALLNHYRYAYGMFTRLPEGGLCVMEIVDVDIQENAPVLTAKLWRITPDPISSRITVNPNPSRIRKITLPIEMQGTDVAVSGSWIRRYSPKFSG